MTFIVIGRFASEISADPPPFQDLQGRWCRSVHVTRSPCDECGREGFHKHYLNPWDSDEAREWRQRVTGRG